jgi:hypothetical protein
VKNIEYSLLRSTPIFEVEKWKVIMKTKVNIPLGEEAGPFAVECDTLRQHIDEVAKHPGEYVLVKGRQIVGYFKDFEAGLTEGYKRFGLGWFMFQSIDALTAPPIRLPHGCEPVSLTSLVA